jgi:hypothetical protein
MGRGKVKPFAVFAFRFETVVPICFDANWIIGADFVHFAGWFRKLDGEFVLASARRVASTDFVVSAGLYQIDEVKISHASFISVRMLVSVNDIRAQLKNILETLVGSTVLCDFQYALFL